MSSNRIVKLAVVVMLVSVLATTCIALPSSSGSSSLTPDGGVYEYKTEGISAETYMATITGYTEGREDFLTIQTGIEGYPVKAIGPDAFRNSNSLKAVVIPEKVNSIGDYAFADCSSLEAAYFIGEMPSMGKGVFDNTASGFTIYCLNEVWSGYNDYKTAVWSPYEYSDSTGGRYSYYILNDEITIFRYISGENISIPSFIENNGKRYPVVSIGPESFYKCSVKTVTIADGIERIGDRAFSWEHDKGSPLRSVIFPDTLDSIGDEAFRNCKSLVSVDLPKSLRYIGFEAFRDSSLKSIYIPNSVNYVGGGAFYCCYDLKSAKLSQSMIKIPERMFGYCELLTFIEIPDHITSVGASAFYKTGLKSLDFNEVKTIEREAFYDCTNLRFIDADEVRVIDNEAFYGCTSLKSIDFDEIESIGYRSFGKCTSLDYVVFSESLRNLDEDSFRGCTSLSGAYFEGPMPVIGDNAFKNADNDFKVHYLKYYSASWSGFNAYNSAVWDGSSPSSNSGIDNSLMILIAAIAVTVVLVVSIAILFKKKKGRSP